MSEMLERVALAIRNDGVCGFSIGEEHVFCDDPRLPAEFHYPKCECKQNARLSLETLRTPTGDQMDAARYLIQWLSFERPTESALLKHCASLRKEPPPECRDVEHVPPARMIAFWIYRAMIDAALGEKDGHD